MAKDCFEWDPEKDLAIQLKHGIAFKQAQFAVLDPHRVIAKDLTHSTKSEHRYLLFWLRRQWCSDGEIYVSPRDYSNHRRRILEERTAGI